MRILHVIRTLDPAWGGPVEALRGISSQARKRGHVVEILCLDDPADPWLASWAPLIHALGPRRSRYGFAPALDNWLTRNVARFDIVIVNGIWMYFSFAVWKATRASGPPYYVFTHGALDPWFKKRYPLKHVKKVVYWRLIEHKVLRDARNVLFTSESELTLAQDAFFPYECQPCVVGYGIQESPAASTLTKAESIQKLTAKHPDLNHRRFLLFLARIHEKKGLDLLLKAYAKTRGFLNHLALVIAGPGSPGVCESLNKQARALDIQGDVIWAGPLYGDTKWEVLRSCEAYVLPSHQENFGVGVVEALAAGIPVLISDKVNIHREINRDKAGLVEADTLEGTTKLLMRWSNLTLLQIAEMKRNARECFAKRFDLSVASEQYFQVIEKPVVQSSVAVTGAR